MADLTDKEEVFLEALFDTENNPDMDPEVAKTIAGYGKGYSTVAIMRKIKPKLQDDTQNYFLSVAPKAAKTIVGFLHDDNPLPGSEKVLAAAIQVLDRAGITKKEKQEVEIQLPVGVVMLPPMNASYEYNSIEGTTVPSSQIERQTTPQIGDGQVASESYI